MITALAHLTAWAFQTVWDTTRTTIRFTGDFTSFIGHRPLLVAASAAVAVAVAGAAWATSRSCDRRN